jgi:drug/metabolite transporter (DMT)-like permease
MASTPAVVPAPAVRAANGELFAYSGLSIATLCWASAFIAGKVALAEMTPLAVGAWRYALAALVLFPFAIRVRVPWSSVPVAPLLILILCGGLVYPWLFLVALENTSATNASLLIALNPAFTLLLSPLVGERIDGRRFGGLALALIGAATVITHGNPSHIIHLATNPLNNGDVLAILAASCWACFNLASRRVVAVMPPPAINGLAFGAGSIALFLLARNEQPIRQLWTASPAALECIAVMALLSSVVAGHFFLSGVRTVGVNRSVVFVYLVPVLTAVLSVALLGESFHITQAIGGAAVLSGVYLTTRPADLATR